MSFDWQTQEEISWEEPPPLPEEPVEPRPRRRLWPYVILMILVGAAVAAFVVVRDLNRRVAAAEAEARVAVISSYNVIQQAAVDEDAELFVGFLSGRDANWSAGLEEAVREGAYLNRDGLGLRRLGEAGSAEETAVVTLSPDLTSAEMTVTHTYGVDIGNGLTETVLLGQTAVYRLGPNRWLLAPPEPEFWGEMLVSNGRYLTTRYPERDAEIGRRLAADLDRKLIEMCTQITDLNCPPDLQINLELSPDPHTLLPLRDAHLPTGRSLSLPTPTLSGIPQNENGYRTLQRGYSRWLVASVISDLVGWVCCDHELFYQALVDIQWQQLGLTTLPTIDYNYVQTHANQLDEPLDLWNNLTEGTLPQERQIVYALVEFLTSEANIPTPHLQREFGQLTYRNWLLNVSGIPFADLEQAWQRFLNGKIVNS